MLEALSILGDFRSLGSIEVIGHTVVEGEQAGGSTNFSTHVANGGHSRARQGFNTGSIVFDDGTSSTLDGEDTSDLEDDIWRKC